MDRTLAGKMLKDGITNSIKPSLVEHHSIKSLLLAWVKELQEKPMSMRPIADKKLWKSLVEVD